MSSRPPLGPRLGSPRGRRLLPLLLVIIVAVSGCTSRKQTLTTTRDTTVHSTVTSTRSGPPPTFRPKPAATVAPLAPGQAPAAGETEKPCPYIASSGDQNRDVNVAAIVGSHVYRTTVLSGLKPVGCRFYFYAPPHEAIASITTRTFPTAVDAHNAMVLTGQAGAQVSGQPNLVRGVDGVLYRTKFFGPDGERDWACAFAKGKVMVIVHTRETVTSADARFLAQAIAPKI